jgi:hypothetical protein
MAQAIVELHMQSPLSSAAQDLGLMPNPMDQMDEAKKRRQKELGTAAEADPSTDKFSSAVMDLLGGGYR